MTLALLIIAALFAVLLVGRVGGARRSQVLKRWPAFLLAAAALYAFFRGAIWPGVALALIAGLAWEAWPGLTSPRSRAAKNFVPDPADQEARIILGVGADATPQEIRAAYRAKMATAHPDRGGTHAEAARLTAARDRLLRNRR
jgi:hypothetical protein